MPDSTSLKTEVELIEQERDDWKNIGEAFARSDDDGFAALAGKNERCGLCPAYKKTIIWNGHTLISCKGCPVIRVFRRTCYTMWMDELGFFPGREKDDVGRTKRAVAATYFAMQFILEVINHGI